MSKCIKKEVIAIIENNGRYWIDSNWCENPQKECPRLNMKTGEGYNLCKDICKQLYHAEVNVCIKAGKNAQNGTLYLLGHNYCCDDCKKIIKLYGVKDVIIGKLPENIKRLVM